MTFAGVVLVGGRNRRMEGDKKAFLTYKGDTFLDLALKNLKGMNPIYISVEDKSLYDQLNYPCIEDLYKGIGPLGGVYSALCRIEEEGVLVIPCDMPKLSNKVIEGLIEIWQTSKCSVVLVDKAGRKNPLIAIYHKSCLATMEEMILNHQYKMGYIFKQIDYKELVLEDLLVEEGSLDNINTVEEYKNLL